MLAAKGISMYSITTNTIVRHAYSYGGDEGLFELAVVKFNALDKWHLTYDTPITGDVIGYLTPAEVEDLLAQIEALPVEAAA